MPIGKNSIKRVANNGYSKVVSEAPDMDNSVVAEAPAPVEKVKKTAPATKKTVKKSTPVSKKSADKKPVLPKTAEVAPKGYFNIGDEMPIYLL